MLLFPGNYHTTPKTDTTVENGAVYLLTADSSVALASTPAGRETHSRENTAPLFLNPHKETKTGPQPKVGLLSCCGETVIVTTPEVKHLVLTGPRQPATERSETAEDARISSRCQPFLHAAASFRTEVEPDQWSETKADAEAVQQKKLGRLAREKKKKLERSGRNACTVMTARANVRGEPLSACVSASAVLSFRGNSLVHASWPADNPNTRC